MQYGSVLLYIDGLGFLTLKFHPNTSQIFTLWQQGSIG